MGTPRIIGLIWLSLLALPTLAVAAETVPTQQQLDKSLVFGAVAAKAPLCGLRDLAWAEDLRRAELQALGVRPPRTDNSQIDPPPRRGTELAVAALSYAEDEALEDFAQAPETICGELPQDPHLPGADQMVAAYRAGISQPVW